MDEFKSGFRKLLILVLAVGVAGTCGAYVLGPWFIRKMYSTDLTSRTLAMLALGSALYMLALSLAQAVIALNGHMLVGLGWGTGMATFVVVTWLSSSDLFRRIEWGLVASSAAAMVAFALALRHRLRVGVTPTQGSMMEAMMDVPYDG
jgi:O-antigen/teichoic acid export membrane protein